MLGILFSNAQLPKLARWNLILSFSCIVVLFYSIKWITRLKISDFLILFLLVAVINVCYIKFNGITSIKISQKNKIYDSHRRAVLITGCDTGFGFFLAKRLSDLGYQIFAGCLHPYQDGGKELGDISKIHVLEMDVSKTGDVSHAVDHVKKHLGSNELWAVVNNAGIGKGTEIEITSMASVEEVLSVNLLGTIRVTKAFLPLLRKSKGRVINVASMGGRLPMPGFLPYSTSKSAVISFSDGLRMEVAKYGIDVVTIEPWIYKTKLSNPSHISSEIGKQFEETKNGESDKNLSLYVKKIQRNSRTLFKSFVNPNVHEVIDAMEDAVTNKCPPYSYRPGELYLNVFFYLLTCLPKPLVDYVISNFIFKCS